MPIKPFTPNIANLNDHQVIMNAEYYEAQLKRLAVEEKKMELQTKWKFEAQQQQFKLDQERIQLLKSLLTSALNEDNCSIFSNETNVTPVFNADECAFLRKRILDIVRRWNA